MTEQNETPIEEAKEPKADVAPIRGLRVMAGVRWLLLVAVAALAATTWWTLVLRAAPIGDATPRYYCPMHPQITSHDPGTCPICFMTLEPIPTARHAAVDDAGVPEAPEPRAGDTPLGTVPVMLTTERRQSSGLTTAAAHRIELEAGARWPAVIEARDGARSEARVRTAAFVERIAVRETGAHVRRGQTLAWLYSPEVLRAEQELLTAHAWTARATSDEMPHEHPMSETEAAARQRLELLGLTRTDVDAVLASGTAPRTFALRAPATGIVTAFGAAVGTYAEPTDVLYEITDYARVRVVASVLDTSELALASSHAELVADGADPIALELELIEPTTETGARATRLRFLAANDDGSLRPGAIGEVVVQGSARSVLVVPRDALIDRGLVQYVFVERGGGLFEPRVVEPGALIGDEREILAGLGDGDRVVTRGAFVLDSESRLASAVTPVADAGVDTGTPERSAQP